MRNSLRLLLVPILLTLGLANCGQKQEAAKRELLYTAIPDQNSTELIEKFKPFSDHLSQVLGVPVRYVPARDYQASVEMFRNGDVQLAWFGGLTGVQARAAVPEDRAAA